MSTHLKIRHCGWPKPKIVKNPQTPLEDCSWKEVQATEETSLPDCVSVGNLVGGCPRHFYMKLVKASQLVRQPNRSAPGLPGGAPTPEETNDRSYSDNQKGKLGYQYGFRSKVGNPGHRLRWWSEREGWLVKPWL